MFQERRLGCGMAASASKGKVPEVPYVQMM
jgi:hypothetical protein